MEINIKKAKNILSNGGLVIFPTETVYGLGGDATNIDSIKKIYEYKNRPLSNPIICHFKNLSCVQKNFFLNERALMLANTFWPGPLTLILEKKQNSLVNPIVSNNGNYVGCRVPSHPIARKLLEVVDFPIAAPSANISSKLSTTRIDDISEKLKKNIYYLDGGESVYGLESTVINLTENKSNILRLGSITHEDIKKLIPEIIINKHLDLKLSPGQLYRHYSPNKPIRINVKEVYSDEALLNFGENNLKSKIIELNLSKTENLIEAAKNFYNYLHILDKSNCIKIAVAPIPNHDLGKTINDRLIRASNY